MGSHSITCHPTEVTFPSYPMVHDYSLLGIENQDHKSRSMVRVGVSKDGNAVGRSVLDPRPTAVFRQFCLHSAVIMTMYDAYSEYRGGSFSPDPLVLKKLRLRVETDDQQLKKLKICGMDLEELPPEVFQMTELEVRMFTFRLPISYVELSVGWVDP